MKNRIKLSFSILIIFLVTIFQFCRKEEIKKIIKVTTGEISEIATNSATAKGEIIDVGGGTLLYGHCWSTSQKPTYDNEKTILYTKEIPGVFSSSLTGLSPGTTYYIRAFAYEVKDENHDGINDGIIVYVYGNENNFKTEDQTLATVITGSVNKITPNTAKITSILSNPGSGVDSVLQHGHCWSTSQEPTISNNKTELGTRNSTGEFISDITGLQKDTKYYVRAYATNEAGTAYGNEISFTTYTRVPTIITTPISSITETSIATGGNITDNGGDTITSRGACWSTSPNPTILDNITTDGSGSGIFTSSITGLSTGSTYYVRAYATNSICTAYGNEISFASDLPTLNTTPIGNVTSTSAQTGGNISDDGGATVTARGVCWSTSPNPTFSDNHTIDGTGSGNFLSTISDLTRVTTYYVRAYATNSAGTAYGNEIEFMRNSTISDFDGNVYQTVQIGNQIWMKENLKTTHYADGTAIPLVESTSAWAALGYTDKAYSYYGNSTANRDVYGALYTWAAAMNGAISSSANPSGVQGVCPDGWHMPSDAEWTVLTEYLGGEAVAGGKLKEAGTTHWWTPNIGATNSSGFTALPSAYRSGAGDFDNIGEVAHFWSSTEDGSSSAWARKLNNFDSEVLRIFYNLKNYGFSVRCLRDE